MRSSKRFSPEGAVQRKRGRSQFSGSSALGDGSVRQGPPLCAPRDVGPKSVATLDGTLAPPPSGCTRTGLAKSSWTVTAASVPKDGAGPASPPATNVEPPSGAASPSSSPVLASDVNPGGVELQAEASAQAPARPPTKAACSECRRIASVCIRSRLAAAGKVRTRRKQDAGALLFRAAQGGAARR
jgi:hypothetical protein